MSHMNFDPLEMGDPFPDYAVMRKESPIFFDPKSQSWVLASYKDVRAVMADEARFSAEAERESYAGLCPEAESILAPIYFRQLYGLSTTENPDHDRLKKVAMPVFNEMYLERLKPKLRDMADELLNPLANLESFDALKEVANPFPVRAIFQILGVPEKDVDQVKEWSGSRLALTWGEATEQVQHAKNVVKYWEYSCELVSRKIKDPQDDLPSVLGKAINDGVLSKLEVDRFCYGLLFSGHATTSAFLAESIRYLHAINAWKDIASGQITPQSTTDELLRLCPSAITRRRLALEDVTIGEQHIPKGSVLLLLIGSANRDEAIFDNPNFFDPNRHNANKHLSFGYGFHFCIGAKIVKLEHAVLLERLTKRFPHMQLATGYVPKYSRNLSIRMLSALPVSTGVG